MDVRDPVIPIGQLKTNRNFPDIDLPFGRYGGFIYAAGEDRGQRVQVVLGHGIYAGPACPVADWSTVQARSGLIRRVPRSAIDARRWVPARQAADIAGNLHTLILSQTVVFTSNNNGIIRIIEFEQVTSAGGVTVHAVSLELLAGVDWRIYQRSALPQCLACTNVARSRKRGGPLGWIVLSEAVARD